jgi:hypothetical protein
MHRHEKLPLILLPEVSPFQQVAASRQESRNFSPHKTRRESFL